MGAALAGFGVMLGAFGAHALKDRLDAAALETWHTAAHYHLVHAVAICALSLAGPRVAKGGWAFVAGITVFSGSLYLLALTGMKWLGAITPLGGLCFIGGWFWVAFRAAKQTPTI